MKTKILSILALLLMTVTQGAWAQKTLTVYDGTESNYFAPADMYEFDKYSRSQYIIPAANLKAMNGKIITALKFYSDTSNKTSTCNVDVYLKEVSYTTFDEETPTFETKSGIVYTGTLSIASDGTLTITFTTPYTYNGGNLLIGMENTGKGDWVESYFYGQEVTGAVAYGTNSSSLAAVTAHREDFIPKTTFTYETPVPPTAVDLGLPSGKKWANRNVGATSETGYGTYFAWSSSDIATAQWGNDWRMPTLTEVQELINNTDHVWATIGGVNGMKYMKKTDNSVYIFVPAAGINGNSSVGSTGVYWTSTEANANEAYELYLNASETRQGTDRKTHQFTIRPVQMFAGEGTEASPYLIASTTDWNNLSAAVNGGETYSGNYFKMTANVGTVSTTVGTGANPFNGTFDGNGHTLDVNISNSNPDTRTAPFAWAGGSAVIKNLHVTGSLTNTARTSGIVGSCYATTQISSCRVSATISGGNHTSGISISGGQITNCLFDGMINGTGSTAGFATYVADGTKITNCLFKPQSDSSIPSSQGCFYTSESGKTPTLTNCYYTSLAGGVAQGTDGSGMTAAQLVENLGASNWKVVNSNAIPKVHPGLSGLGTEASPYLIASTTDWNNLVSAVNAGETYSGNYFKMTANVGTVSTWMTGTFSGTFDGDGKTLTVDYSATTENCAPFGTLSGATVKKLKVAGSISSNQKLVAGIAALCSSTGNNVTNCLVSATINSSYSGNAADGGLVAVVDNGASLNVTGCAFAGKMLTTNGTTSCGGIVGWRRPSGTVTITNCLYAPTSATGSETWIESADGENGNANFCRWNTSEPTIENCYYTTDFSSGSYTAQGMQARTIVKGDGVSSLSVTKGDGTEYDVSGITVYSNGIDFNDGSTTTFYGGSGQTVSLALTAATRTGYHFKQYAASQGTLSDETTNTPTLTMPAANSTANDVVTISAQYDPTYNATFADGNDNTDWTISPTQQIEGGTVTVRYEGENKVKSVTVTNKYAIAHSLAASVVGDIVGTDGNAYAVAEKDKLPVGVTAAGVVTYKSGENGFVVALQNLATKYSWSDAFTAAAAYTPAVSGQMWKLGTKDEMSNAIVNDYAAKYGYITAAGGTFPYPNNYWSATEVEGYTTERAWRIWLNESNVPAWHDWDGVGKTYLCQVRPIIAF